MNKQKRSRLIIEFFIIIFGSLINIYFSTLFHQILSGGEIEVPNIKMFIISIRDKNHLKLFFSLELLVLLLGIIYISINDKTYQSDLIEITPNISTPAPAGQKQFGSARWMTNEEKKKTFPICKIDKTDKVIDYLIKHGYDDLKDDYNYDFQEEGEKDI